MGIQKVEIALTLGEVNRELRKRGIEDKLVKGNGYYYFTGDASTWPDNSVHVYNISDLTLDQIVDSYNRLKDEADPDLQARLLEQRYGKKAPIQKQRR